MNNNVNMSSSSKFRQQTDVTTMGGMATQESIWYSSSTTEDFYDSKIPDKKLKRWSIARAIEWYSKLPEWIIGCNFLPSSAINQLEMWQAETYDPKTIEREIIMAEKIGFNTLRVYLHDLVWEIDPVGYLERIEHFLGITSSHNMFVILVLFDDCHRPDPKHGPQPLPIPKVHNSGWKHSPGQRIVHQFHDGTVSAHDRQRLKNYVTSVITRFAKDRRVLMWDIYNEPGQSNNGNKSFNLLKLTWDWAQSVRPSQPLTSCLDGSLGNQNIDLNAERSDVITFHLYQGPALQATIMRHKKAFLNRPVICTEYMAREFGTTFKFSLPIFKRHNVGCISWGLVAGKSQTHFNWETVQVLEKNRAAGLKLLPGDPIPEPLYWFHDIFRIDGSPYDPNEITLIKAMVGRRSNLPLFPAVIAAVPAGPLVTPTLVCGDNGDGDSHNLYSLEHITDPHKRKGVFAEQFPPQRQDSSSGSEDEAETGGDTQGTGDGQEDGTQRGRTILLNLLRGSSPAQGSMQLLNSSSTTPLPQSSSSSASLVPIKSTRFPPHSASDDLLRGMQELKQSLSQLSQAALRDRESTASTHDLRAPEFSGLTSKVASQVGSELAQILSEQLRGRAKELAGQVGSQLCSQMVPHLARETAGQLLQQLPLQQQAQQGQIEHLLQGSLENKAQQILLPRLLGALQRVQQEVLEGCRVAQEDSADVKSNLQSLREATARLDQSLCTLRSSPNPT